MHPNHCLPAGIAHHCLGHICMEDIDMDAYKLGFTCGYRGTCFVDMYDEYTECDILYKAGYVAGVREARLDMWQHMAMCEELKGLPLRVST